MEIVFDLGFGKDRTITTIIIRNTRSIQSTAFKIQPTRFVTPIEEIDSVAALRYVFYQKGRDCEMKGDYYLTELSGSFAFLEGDAVLDEHFFDVFKHLEQNGKNVVIINNLYRDPNRLREVVHYDNILIFSTGVRRQYLANLVEIFDSLNYKPKSVIFLHDSVIEIFHRKILQMPHTQFYVMNWHDGISVLTLEGVQ